MRLCALDGWLAPPQQKQKYRVQHFNDVSTFMFKWMSVPFSILGWTEIAFTVENNLKPTCMLHLIFSKVFHIRRAA